MDSLTDIDKTKTFDLGGDKNALTKAEKYDRIVELMEPYLVHKNYNCLFEKIREIIEG